MGQKHTWSNLIWQPLIAVFFVMFILFFMDHFANSDVLWAVGAGSLSSSCYIVFGKPSSSAADPKRIVGGYLIGILTGIVLRLLTMHFHDFQCGFLGTPHFHVIGVVAAFSVGLCLFFMSLLKLEHPPAAGMALVLLVDMRDYGEILLIILSAFLLAFIRYFLRKRLVDLV